MADGGDAAIEAGTADGGDAAIDAGDVGIDLTPDPSCDRDPWVVLVKGRVEDERSAGIAGATVRLCTESPFPPTTVCTDASTADAAGNFEILVPRDFRCASVAFLYAALPGADRTMSFCNIPLDNAPIVELAQPVVLFDTRRPTMLPPVDNPADQRVVAFDLDGVSLLVRPSDLEGGEATYRSLAARTVPIDAPNNCVKGTVGPGNFLALYGFSPEARSSGDLALIVENHAGLAPGTMVQFWQLVTFDCVNIPGTIITGIGIWAGAGPGQVTNDGSSIIANQSLRSLCWIGITRL